MLFESRWKVKLLIVLAMPTVTTLLMTFKKVHNNDKMIAFLVIFALICIAFELNLNSIYDIIIFKLSI